MKKNAFFLPLILNIFVVLCNVIPCTAQEYYSAQEIKDMGQDMLDALSGGTDFYNDELCSGAGTSVNDWLVIGACRLELSEYSEKYEQALLDVVAQMYEKDLASQKVTEWQRISLTFLAMGVDPCDIEGHNLIADGSYNRGAYASLGKQGVNSYSFALICCDAVSADIPSDASYSREDIISYILQSQVDSGAFTVPNLGMDVDITAMAIQALAPYCDEISTVKASVDNAISWLSSVMQDDGTFANYGIKSAETTAQVIIALTEAGVDVQMDERFIRNGKTVLEGLLAFRTDDGTFAHVAGSDGSLSTNGFACAQSLCALASIYRFQSGLTGLYEFSDAETQSDLEYTDESTFETKTEIDTQNSKPDVFVTETANETCTDTDDDTENTSKSQKASLDETGDVLEASAAENEKKSEVSDRLIYLISGFVIFLGTAAYFVMKFFV